VDWFSRTKRSKVFSQVNQKVKVNLKAECPPVNNHLLAVVLPFSLQNELKEVSQRFFTT
jgi:hypothetical protein